MWNWSFGDGTFSNETNPMKTYQFYNKYTVNLTITNGTISNTTSKKNYINVTLPLPLANFTVNTTRGTIPLTVQFADASTNNVTKWNWSFGDGNVSNQTNPIWTYVNDGNYTVSLNVTNGRSNITIRQKYIDALPPLPVIDFNATNRTGVPPLFVRFNITSNDNQTKWNWTFGDGGNFTTTNIALRNTDPPYSYPVITLSA